LCKLGVTVRRWTGPRESNHHGNGNQILENFRQENAYNQTHYENAILDCLDQFSLSPALLAFYPRSIFMAFDNPTLKDSFRAFFNSERFRIKTKSNGQYNRLQVLTLGEQGEIIDLLTGSGESIFGSHSDAQPHKLSHLKKAAIEVLALSRTSALIGNKKSSFLELAWWLGGTKQTVLHPRDTTP